MMRRVPRLVRGLVPADVLREERNEVHMNRDMMRRTADAIEAHEEQFDQSEWLHKRAASECGACACVAGFAVSVDMDKSLDEAWDARKDGSWPVSTMREKGAEVLDLTEYQATALFAMWPKTAEIQHAFGLTDEKMRELDSWLGSVIDSPTDAEAMVNVLRFLAEHAPDVVEEPMLEEGAE